MINGRLDGVAGLAWLALWLGAPFFVVFWPALVAASLVLRIFPGGPTFRRLGSLVAAILFGWAWMARLEPAHRPLVERVSLAADTALDVVLVVLGAAFVYVTCARRYPTRWHGPLATVAVGGLLSAGLLALAHWQVPRRDRDAAIERLQAFLAPPVDPAPDATPGRVLVVGVDGMDWNAVDVLVRAGDLPAITRLLRAGRAYQLDPGAMRLSPELWSAIYTGWPAGRSGIETFWSWNFAGLSSRIVALPKFGTHEVFFLGRLLSRLEPVAPWRHRLVSTADLASPPIWTIASAQGRRVGVFDPVPYALREEVVDGFLAWNEEGDVAVRHGDAAGDRVITPIGGDFDSVEGLLVREGNRVRLAASLFAEGRPDLGIYYTKLVDLVAHHDSWLRPSQRGLTPDGRSDPPDRDTLSRTGLLAAYRRVDAGLAAVLDAFGTPAHVVLVSDHGFNLNGYEHNHGPFGVLVVSPSPEPGYGGVAPVLGVAPTVLALLGLPPDETMAPPLDAPDGPRVPAYRLSVTPRFLPAVHQPDSGLLERLRAIGYVGPR